MVYTHSPPHVATVIGLPSYNRPDVYKVKFKDGFNAEYALSENVLEAVPTSCPTPAVSLLPDWIKGGSNVTLFLNSMTKPRHGKLFFNETSGIWTFCPGNTTDLSKGTPL